MEIPKYYEMHRPFLELLKDGAAHPGKDVREQLAAYFHLDRAALDELLPSGRQTVFSNRFSWASTYLRKAGLVNSPVRGTFMITPAGLNVLRDNPGVINNEYLAKFEGFRKFQETSQHPVQAAPAEDSDTPDDTFEASFRKISESLADELLGEVMKLTPQKFERMVIDLLSQMGYGSFENAGRVTAVSGDEGIDGIIMEDKLGFDLIYIQAKKWDLSSTVGRPAIQGFVGAITGKGGKGLFVTTAKYSKQALEYANHQHVILIDGEKLVKLMIEHNFGVSVKKTFEIKAIDTDLFNEYAE